MLMHDNNEIARFFLAVSSPQGFASRFSELSDAGEDWHTYIIKGGPGTGKSTMMEQVAEALLPYDSNAELIYCSSDPSSLDALIFHTLKISFVDGTDPHVVEPKYIGACETIIQLSECFDYDLLYQQRKEIKLLTNENRALQERSNRFLTAAGTLISDTARLALEATDIPKIIQYGQRFSHREFKPLKGKAGREYARFLSAITPQGIKFFSETVPVYCDRIYVIDDDYGVIARILLETIRSYALTANYDTIGCYCPISPFDKLEHLLIPEAGIGFVSSNKWHKQDFSEARKIHSRRFIDTAMLKGRRQRINFNRKAAKELLHEAIALKQEAKEVHDLLEEYYVSAMDFEEWKCKMNAALEQVARRF